MDYKIKIWQSRRMTTEIVIDRLGGLLIKAPKTLTVDEIALKAQADAKWIEAHMPDTMAMVEGRQRPYRLPVYTSTEIAAMTSKAVQYIPPKVAHYARLIGVPYSNITIKYYKSKLAFCSSTGDLHFSYLTTQASEAELDYLIVHELCHITPEKNASCAGVARYSKRNELFPHGPSFWQRVAAVVPDYKALDKSLGHKYNIFCERSPKYGRRRAEQDLLKYV